MATDDMRPGEGADNATRINSHEELVRAIGLERKMRLGRWVNVIASAIRAEHELDPALEPALRPLIRRMLTGQGAPQSDGPTTELFGAHELDITRELKALADAYQPDPDGDRYLGMVQAAAILFACAFEPIDGEGIDREAALGRANDQLAEIGLQLEARA
jgi:hypothetical protein